VQAASENEAQAPTILKEAASRLEALTMGDVNIVDSLLQDPELASVFQG